MKYRIQFYLLLFFRQLLLWLPEKTRFDFGNFLGKAAYYLISSRRQTTLWNLQLAFPEKTEEERKKIAVHSYQIMTKYFLSTLWYDSYLQEKVHIYNQSSMKKAYWKGRGVMAAVMHMGNMEAAVKAGDGFPIVTVAKDQRNPYLEKFIIETRKKNLKLDLLTKSKQTVRQLQAYQKKEKKYIYALFSDHRDKGAHVHFFGLETVAPTGAVSLAYKYNMPLFLVYSCLEEDNTTSIYISEEIPLIRTENSKQDILENTQILIHKMEDVIRKHPEQWMWFHDRWNLYRDFKKEGLLPPFLREKNKGE
ncbi:lauroyl acyltransferase [Fusobacterium necrophorum]|uniref:lysophospholipid acyltransferase family protein n=1 Tax=Fusobacterium necrophorum TaxID=859 RepID=UPI00254BC18E|nr:lauroyl acyltransferase [Fusobacterium necrophorum]MDK4484185.1 lauroyl acyltransferase [Fusobacterium necrophorum]MDK4500637.1 lauroyl acyltransferase [Fusobacterium necrophorum]MDK4508580.1 lauroyl acyltransferase [Fusobacterium necrophorum]MDK4514761.1 lauroyl acyltransferase [Fusobacterium necrophorum]MDK4521003.1 lauroyl acyltransferase [Fusobacterium necrophorum]